MLLGRAFLEAGFPDEAVDTLQGVIGEYPVKGDERSIEMHYWYARALEEKARPADGDQELQPGRRSGTSPTATSSSGSSGCATPRSSRAAARSPATASAPGAATS